MEWLIFVIIAAAALICPRLIEVETRTRLFELVERLPKDQRRVIVLRFGEEKSIRARGTCGVSGG